ncbi:MAG: nucleotide exchange factor GrpE [Deltaproteobacteria bacterium]|nr:nucleotide exchange factor GrpE [Deltaproteobacteria bacterium]
MSKHKRKDQKNRTPGQDVVDESKVASPEESGGAKGTKMPELSEESPELTQARREVRENYDRFLRVAAEFENYKKRVEKEKSDLVKYANEGLIKDLLGVIDNLERALEQAEQNVQAESLVEGIGMILKLMKDTLGKHGVTEIHALGETFNPNLHEAMMHEATDEHAENTVIDEFQKGYVLKDRLLRPSLVKVSKKSPDKADVGAAEE